MSYLTVKYLHISFAALSGSFFLVRGIWMMSESDLLHRKWVRIAPHVIDSLLLLSAVILVVWSGQYPGVQDWLTAKVGALIVYILLGTIALKRGRKKSVRCVAFFAALAVFAYIVAVAATRHAGVIG
jgi:uncharacterized membrane protein SirB2